MAMGFSGRRTASLSQCGETAHHIQKVLFSPVPPGAKCIIMVRFARATSPGHLHYASQLPLCFTGSLLEFPVSPAHYICDSHTVQ